MKILFLIYFQLASALDVDPLDEDLVSIDSEELQKPYRTVAFLLNEREVHMEIIQGSLLPEVKSGTKYSKLKTKYWKLNKQNIRN